MVTEYILKKGRYFINME